MYFLSANIGEVLLIFLATLEQAVAIVFVSLVLIEFVKAYNVRSDRDSMLQQTFANKWLAILWEVAVLACIIYVPLLQAGFGTYDMTPHDWMIMLIPAATISPVLEVAKWCVRKKRTKRAVLSQSRIPDAHIASAFVFVFEG